MGFAPTYGWLFLGRTIAGLAGASFTPAYAYVADVSPSGRRAHSFGLVSASFGIGFILGPAIGGFLGSFGSPVPFLSRSSTGDQGVVMASAARGSSVSLD
jgi:MFS transporter, DHA1 family, tetracycline resistance protein